MICFLYRNIQKVLLKTIFWSPKSPEKSLNVIYWPHYERFMMTTSQVSSSYCMALSNITDCLVHQILSSTAIRTYFKVVLATICGHGNLEECDFGNFQMCSTFSLSHDSFFAEVYLCISLYMLYLNFEKSTTCVST